MNWQQLQHFEKLTEVGHYRRAAEQLYITQPTLSKSISNLEKELGVPLFYKRNNDIFLTIYGKAFHNHVKNAIREVEESLKEISLLSGQTTGTVRIGSIFTVASDYLPKRIKDFSVQYPEVNFSMCQQTSKQNLLDLMEDVIDLAFVSDLHAFESDFDIDSLDSECILNEEILVAMPADHPLAKRGSVKFSEIADETFISYNSRTGIIKSISSALRNAGYNENLSVSYTVNEENAVLGLVRAGLGIALICDAPNFNKEGLVFLRLSDICLYRSIFIAWKKGEYIPPIVTKFKNFVLASSETTL